MDVGISDSGDVIVIITQASVIVHHISSRRGLLRLLKTESIIETQMTFVDTHVKLIE